MPGNLPVPACFQMRLTWLLNSVPHALNIIHFENTAGTEMTQSRATAISTQVKGLFTSSSLAGDMHPTLLLMHVDLRDMDDNSNPWWLGGGLGTAGTGTGNPLPAAVSLVVSLSTGLRGRSYNGRVYLCGFTTASSDTTGNATATTGSHAAAFIEQMRTGLISSQQMAMCVVSRWTTPPTAPPNTPPTERNPPVTTPVTLAAVKDLRWDTQRRRAIAGI